jgi:hypothetical protein
MEVEWDDLGKKRAAGRNGMYTVISVTPVLACAFSLSAQITVAVNRFHDGLPAEITIRNNSAVGLTAFAITVNHVARSSTAIDPVSHKPFIVHVPPAYVDTAMDTATQPLLPNQQHTFRTGILIRPELPTDVFEQQPIVTAGIFADGTTTGDAALLTKLMLRRSNMLLAVETTLETLSHAGRHNVPRDPLIGQFRKMADSLNRSYLAPEQQVGRDLYQSIIGKLMNLPEGQVGSPFPPGTFVAQETEMLNRLRFTLMESQPRLADAALIGQ